MDLIIMAPQEVFDYYGGKQATADRLQISYQAVQQWDDKGRVPMGRQYEIEIDTSGALRADRPAISDPEQNAA